MNVFTPQDLEYIKQRGSNPKTILHQLECFKNGFHFAKLQCAATIDDGIVKLESDQVEELVADYPNMLDGKKILKFVPASGAASRMFKELYSYLSDDSSETISNATRFLQLLPQFPFYDALAEVILSEGSNIRDLIAAGDYKTIVGYILEPKGLNYGHQAKGLLPFHRYEDGTRTAVEEHLVEAALYAQNEGVCALHFTVSPNSLPDFESLLRSVLPQFEERYGVRYEITFSAQDPSTDTIAATLDNTPFRDDNGKLLFRPAGHGALIYNMNLLDADLVFVKNIDNVTVEERIMPTVNYKKTLAAYMLQLQERTFQYLLELEAGFDDEMTLFEIMDFAESELMIHLDDDISRETLYSKLNRPIRVCGMVRNEGEPGGGPFWVENANGESSLQIVESSQINLQDDKQMTIKNGATHFNPVDMVCGLKNYKGKKFNLLDFVDPEMGFISTKSYGDRMLKALELPGLWNGAMSDWITVFVEVPIETFNPVKTVFDLLR